MNTNHNEEQSEAHLQDLSSRLNQEDKDLYLKLEDIKKQMIQRKVPFIVYTFFERESNFSGHFQANWNSEERWGIHIVAATLRALSTICKNLFFVGVNKDGEVVIK